MKEHSALVSGRIRQELDNLNEVVERVTGALQRADKHPEEKSYYLDSAALNMHDFYAGLERIFQFIAAHLEQSVPSGREWHRELLNQMNIDINGIRPAVLSSETTRCLDEYLRFRHVVRNVYAFHLDAERVVDLAEELSDCFRAVQIDLRRFAAFLDNLSRSLD